MKKLLLLSVILLAACNKQDEPSVEPSKATIIPYVKKHHAKSDPPAQLDFLQLVQVVISSFPNAQASYNSNATELRLLSKHIPSDSKFKTYENWYSIKITRNIDSENWSNFLVEIRDNQSYEQSKIDAFNACKNVWRNIDHRVPTVINELAGRINKYGKNSSSATAQHIIRYGYLFNLDASHFNDGYPVSCSISYNNK
ncbi:MAG: hypothetical protein ACKOUU_01530 [Acinetobacter tjernbergiae]